MVHREVCAEATCQVAVDHLFRGPTNLRSQTGERLWGKLNVRLSHPHYALFALSTSRSIFLGWSCRCYCMVRMMMQRECVKITVECVSNWSTALSIPYPNDPPKLVIWVNIFPWFQGDFFRVSFWALLKCIKMYSYKGLVSSLYTLPETNSSHLKMDGWKMTRMVYIIIYI